MKLSSPNVINLPWRNDAAEYWFSSLKDYPWAILLHSGYSNYANGRFDILSADPIGTIVTRGDITYLKLNKTSTSLEDPFILLNRTLNACEFYAEKHPDFPFQGGALGFFGYDLIRRFEKLPENALCDIHLPDMAIGFYDWALIIDHHKKNVSLLSHSNTNARLAWLNKMQRKIKNTDFHITTEWISNMNLEEYSTKFYRIQNYLQEGDCYQINLAQRFQAGYKGDEWQAFTVLNKQNRAPFSAFLRLEDGVILSFSPEQFIQLYAGNIQTRPIKGTLSRLSSIEEDKRQIQKLANSIKDQTENLMIVDLMRNDIGRVAEPGSVQVPKLFTVESFSNVHHLVSTITARLSNCYNACDLLRAVFPGGSITGAPKLRAMEIIEELEPHRRNVWCGSIGYLSACGRMDTNIIIRTLIAFNNQLYCYSGGGIVADSQLQTEYKETFDKVNQILDRLKNRISAI